MVQYAHWNWSFDTIFEPQKQDLDDVFQSFDIEHDIEEIQDVHLHTKARVGNIPMIAVVVDGYWIRRRKFGDDFWRIECAIPSFRASSLW